MCMNVEKRQMTKKTEGKGKQLTHPLSAPLFPTLAPPYSLGKMTALRAEWRSCMQRCFCVSTTIVITVTRKNGGKD